MGSGRAPMTPAKLAPAILILALLCVESSPALATAQPRDRQGITGSRRISVTIPSGAPGCPGPSSCQVLALATATREGTVVQTAALPDVSSGPAAWSRVGPGTFQIRSTYFRFDPGGTPIGTSETVTQTQLGPDGTIATGTFENTLLDLTGAVIDTSLRDGGGRAADPVNTRRRG